MANATIQSFPARKIDRARQALKTAYARLVRSATRTGQTAPAAPELVVLAERTEATCTECGVISDDGFFGRCLACKVGYTVARQVVDLEIRSERPVLAGWDFLAVVEPLDGGNLIRQVPGAEIADGELAPWRTSTTALDCDHCHTARKRLETFIVRADGSDPAIAKGTYKQVGRNCLEAFLGGRSAAAIVASLGWPALVAAEGSDDLGGSDRGHSTYEPIEFMAWVASVVRINGWVSKTAARDSTDKRATADVAQYLNTYQYDARARAKWEQAREEYKPTDEDRARGLAALEWARDLTAHTDYEANLSLVARQRVLEPSHAGILASAVAAHARILGEQVKCAARVASLGESTYIGTVGEKKRAFGQVTVERISGVETAYGTLHIHTFRDASGNAIVWRTGEAHGAPGSVFDLIGTIKAHTEFRGEKQTEVTRCKLAEVVS